MKRMILILLSVMLFVQLPTCAAGKEGLAEKLEIRLERYSDEQKVSRTEFACMTARALKFAGVLSAEDPFSDVKRYEYGAGELAFLKQRGIVFGDENGVFDGKSPITLNQALVIAARATLNGYIDYTKINRSAVNFEALARKLNLRRGVVGADSETLTANDACIIIYNMLMADAMDLSAVTMTEGGYFSNFEARGSLLSQYWDCVRTEGVVTANGKTDLYGGGALKENQIRVNGVVFTDESGDAGAYIGQRVTVISDSDDKLIYAFPTDNRISEIDFDSDIKYDNFSLNYYDDNGDETVARLADSYSVIYNGKTYAYDGTPDIFEGDGRVRLIDNNDDGRFDVMCISRFRYMVIDALSYNDLAVYDKLDSTSRLCIDDFTQACSIYISRGGETERADFSELAENMVLRCIISEDGSAGEIYACGDTLSGRVGQMSKQSVTIGGEKYEISDRYFDSSRIISGGEYTFYLSDEGKIIYSAAADGSLAYGYVITAAMEDKAIDASFLIKLLDANGETKVLKTADRVMLDGKTVKSDSAGFMSCFVDSGAKTKYQIIKYSLNEKGELNKIDTAASNSAFEEFVGSCNADDNLVCYVPREKLQYKTSQLFVQKFRINTKTVLFAVPESIGTASEGTYGENLFSCVDISFLKNDGRYFVEAYDMGFNGIAKAVVIFTDEQSTVGDSSDVIVVDSVYEAIGDGGAEKKIDYWSSGSFKSAFFSADSEIAAYPEEGDVLRVSYDKDGRISAMNLDYDRSTESIDAGASSSITAQYFVTAADPVYFKENCLIANVNGERMVFTLGGASVVRYSKKSGRLFGSNTGELKEIYARGFEGTKLLLTLNYNSVKNCVIYEDR